MSCYSHLREGYSKASWREVVVVSSDRAEHGLLESVMYELQKRQDDKGDVHPTWFKFKVAPIPEFLGAWECFCRTQVQPDIVLCPTDRWEMTYIAADAFHHNYIVAHLHAGNIGSCHPDEMNRRVISCFSHILFCNTKEDKENLVKFGEEPWRCKVVGSTAFDNIKLDESICPVKMDLESGEKTITPYDLVLLHPDPLSAKQTKHDLDSLLSYLFTNHSHSIIWIGPNNDENSFIIRDYLHHVDQHLFPETTITYLQNVPRPQFLALLKRCRQFVGNSSAMLYEAPFFGTKTVNIGARNKNRKPIKPRVGGSARIAEVLGTIPINDRLRRKRFTV